SWFILADAMSQPLSADHASFLLNAVFLPALQREQPKTRQVLEAIPLDKGDYRPDAVCKTALELAWHIVAAEQRFLSGICTGQFDFTPINRGPEINNSAKIAAWSDETFNANVQQIEKLSGEQLTRMIDFRGLFQFPAVSYLTLAQSHSVHHRGQLSMYLRPMGAKVPSIYGESYDATQDRLAKEGKAS
ncbi:MAG: DinB family protein, partial [Terriglobales bacterium]